MGSRDTIEARYRCCVEGIIRNRSSKNDEFERALEMLRIERNAFNIIHVSGTNGKSSVSHKISQCLISSGLSVGLYTSPHIWDCSERIRIQGRPISCRDFLRLHDRISSIIGGLELHFFSFILLIALLYFEENGTEWVILETGIGGLLDKTNFATNTRVVVITSIGYDHMHILGNRLEDIARQKAGTIKKNSIVVLGPNCYNDDIFIQEANAVGARVIKCKKRAFANFDEENSETARIVFEEALRLGSAPKFALESCLAMRMQVLTGEQIKLAKAQIIRCGNVKVMGVPRAVILDIGHNETAIDRLCNDIVKLFEERAILCVSVSHNRSLGIFNPAVGVRNGRGELMLKDIYFLPSGHDYCRQLSDADQESLMKSVSPELDVVLKRGIEKSKQLAAFESKIDPFDAMLYNAFLEACQDHNVLVITGTAYIMEQAWRSLGLK